MMGDIHELPVNPSHEPIFDWDAIHASIEIAEQNPHKHTFIYHLNANHTALRGCVTCGMTHVTLAAGPDPNALVWHRIKEPEEG